MCCWAVDGEGLAIALVVVSLDQWELDFGIVELLDLVASSFDGSDLFNFDDLREKREVSKYQFKVYSRTTNLN
jgi:hypothetical protein